MKNIDSSELKRIQIDILDYFDAFCKRNDLKYWLDYGTLLGAVRHRGYIPWDDDIDISMLRRDYEKAAVLFNMQSDGTYLFQTPSNCNNTRYPFGKLIDTRTVLYEYGEEGIETGVYIDVFVYDNAPDDAKAVVRIFRRRDLLGRIRRLQLPMRQELGRMKRIFYIVGSTGMRIVPRNVINVMLDKNARKYEHIDTAKVCSFEDPYDETYFCEDKTLFQNLTEVEFEGRIYPAPDNYDHWLGILYGDYMELPPADDRVCHHSFKAWYKETEE